MVDWVLTWMLVILFLLVAFGKLGGILFGLLNEILRNLGFKK